ncbi:LysR substrate-binding domain-containing protein [Inhella gelatinilytica]|uniref:LysR family transcriptional regulator n=1 Tax=Inhella gelatinilytica TaxID=2795030 RepID=A0A931NDU6_9BURK|nr:LysR substrate-binding domain-containing protein [Inhella gelatinilytica]MBH9552605.1 LysR family transcriptional regulator [Inhella gelatinilytica]
MSVELNPLLILLELQQAGALAAAAARLRTTSSALSKQIRALERQAGQELVEHGSKPLRLTEAGRAYALAARQMREHLRQAQDQSAALRQQLGGTLRVAASFMLGHAVLADYAVDFRRRHPQVALDLVLRDDDPDPVAEQFDVVLRHDQGPSADLVARALGANRVRLCGAPAYFERMGKPQKPEDLADHPCLIFHCEGLDSRWRFVNGPRIVVVVPQGPVTCNSDELLLAPLRAGEGLLPCFDWVVARDLREGRLQTCLDDWRFECEAWGAQELWAVYPKGKRGQPKIKAFIDGLAEVLAQLNAGLVRAPVWLGR